MTDAPVPAKASASVVVVREGARAPEVLMLRRNEKIAFHGGAWVFPGGRVDDADVGAGPDSELAVAKRAAAREALEETGLVLGVGAMQPFAHWTTPVDLPKRFATWFFLACADGTPEVRIDNSEIVDYRWLTAEAALGLHRDGELNLPAPTFVTLTGFAQAPKVPALLKTVEAEGIRRFVPRLVKLPDGRCSLYEEDAGYATLDLGTPGPRHRLTMLGTDWIYERDL